jgi:hypothetical protein
MTPANLKNLLAGCNEDHANSYIEYLIKLQSEKKKDGQNYVTKNPWMKHKTDEYLATIFKKVALDGLVFDGEDITLQNTGVSYSYQAFKNKMFNAYPESIVDVSLVHNGDNFQFSKNSGHVKYTHEISNPFGTTERDLVGAYCVIKNKRGEFLTLLSKQDIDKHRRVAKTDFIWANWFNEMALKTIIKKACKQHFKDIFSNIETIDNENYDLDNLVSAEEQEKIETDKFHGEMKWYAVHEPYAYDKILREKWNFKSAREITKPSVRQGVIAEIEYEMKHPPKLAGAGVKKETLQDTEEWKVYSEALKNCPVQMPEPTTKEQCIEAVSQIKQAIDNANNKPEI